MPHNTFNPLSNYTATYAVIDMRTDTADVPPSTVECVEILAR